jgi:hypothetical protein
VTGLVFVDSETTGLDESRGHEMWELALIVREADGDVDDPGRTVDVEYLWQFPVDLTKADLIALNIGGFHERRWPEPVGRDNARAAVSGDWSNVAGSLARCQPGSADDDLAKVGAVIADLTWGRHLVGAVPDFDARMMRTFLRRHGRLEGWHYHLLDVEALAVGAIAEQVRGEQNPMADLFRAKIAIPYKSTELGLHFGVETREAEKHTAMGDARWARDLYDAIFDEG